MFCLDSLMRLCLDSFVRSSLGYFLFFLKEAMQSFFPFTSMLPK